MGYQSAKIEVGSLRYRLKTETKEIHDVADKSMQGFLFDDVAPTQSREAYRHFLLQLYVLYEALEEQLEVNRHHAVVGPIYFPDELNRLRFLAEDLDFYYSNHWRHLLMTEITSGMARYVARIREIGAQQPELLVAHSYTRYLGDMSGGQILRRLIKKRYSLAGEEGVSFYRFDYVESIAKFKDLYTARMNGTELDELGMNEQVEEAKRIFQFNIDVFEQVGAKFQTTDSSISQIPTSITNSKQNGDVVKENKDNDCVTIDVNKANDSSAHWQSVVRMVSFTVGLSATVMMFCPWFRKLVLQ